MSIKVEVNVLIGNAPKRCNKLSKPIKYIVISPNGDRLKVKNMAAFCRSIDLDQSCMTKVAKGKLPHHKGWRAEEVKWK